MAYLLDMNVFLSAKNLHFGMDFCPAFWDWVLESYKAGRVFSIDKVADEIEAGDDELSEWSKALPKGFYLEASEQTVPALGALSRWVTGRSYTPAAINTFLGVADYYLVAHALAGGHVVVTHEVPADTINRVKIPNACLGVGVRCVSPFEMLRRERARFVLGHPG
ncbi:MAG: DUF4411 family protein [Phycisphaeraceae bacterium]|nr:DUF4411 family protein [Phycisphaerales bacterium]MCA9307408.1 DUF4411 family protein [Phycisphaerales bacterium]MCB9842478.1 DUF4411 family protein [Phycisphaeraceae bacterium]